MDEDAFYVTALSRRISQARVQHECCCCDQPIKPGEVYQRTVLLTDDHRIFVEKLHKPYCWEVS